MGFAKCGVERILRKISNTRKKPFRFSFFCKFEKTKMVFANVRFSSPLSVAVARKWLCRIFDFAKPRSVIGNALEKPYK